MQNVRDNLVKAKNNLMNANKKATDVTIKKLTKKNLTMKAKFIELKGE